MSSHETQCNFRQTFRQFFFWIKDQIIYKIRIMSQNRYLINIILDLTEDQDHLSEMLGDLMV